MNKSILTAQHIVKIQGSKIVKYLSKQAQDFLKEALNSDDLNDIDVGLSVNGEIVFNNIKRIEY